MANHCHLKSFRVFCLAVIWGGGVYHVCDAFHFLHHSTHSNQRQQRRRPITSSLFATDPASITANNNNTTSSSSAAVIPETNLGLALLENDMEHVEIVNAFPPLEVRDTLIGENEYLFVKMLRGSANYIAAHRKNTVVLHIPAKMIDFSSDPTTVTSTPPATTPPPTTATVTTDASATANKHAKKLKHKQGLFEKLLDDIALLWLLGVKIVIVIGCRGIMKDRCPGTEEVFHKGLPITNEQELRNIKEIAGYARFEAERQLARALNRKGTTQSASTAKGGNVVSGNFFSAQPIGVRDGVDFQYTGKLRRLETEKIQQAHANNDVVLLTSLGVSPSGEVFWVKSESLAAGVASSLGADKLIYMLEEPSHLVQKPPPSSSPVNDNATNGDGSDTDEPSQPAPKRENVIASFRMSEGKKLLSQYCVSLDSDTGEYVVNNPIKNNEVPAVRRFLERVGLSTSALVKGVKRAHLVCPSDGSLLEELYTRDDGTGTMISRDLYDGMRTATPEDVTDIVELIQPLVDAGIIVERPHAVMEKEITGYAVYTRDDSLLACGQLKLYENGFAEIGCLAVERAYRRSGKGDAMLCYLERVALKSGASILFVLSTQTMQWFLERGFAEATFDDLPPSRRESYNHARKSKIYMKQLITQREVDEEELMWEN